jgi:hypothetical protein
MMNGPAVAVTHVTRDSAASASRTARPVSVTQIGHNMGSGFATPTRAAGVSGFRRSVIRLRLVVLGQKG